MEAGPRSFSVAEVLAHLSHSEGHCYRMRIDRLLEEEMPEFERDDAQIYLDLYRDADAEDSFDHFEEQRDNNVEFLRTLPRAAGERRAMHKEARRNHAAAKSLPRVGDARSRTFHRQIAELIRALKHWKQAGKLGESYKLKPEESFSHGYTNGHGSKTRIRLIRVHPRSSVANFLNRCHFF